MFLLLCSVLISLLVLNVVAGNKEAHWIAAGNQCRRDYGDDDYCIHYSNCVSNKPGDPMKGYPDFCHFSGITPILCCIEKDGYDHYPGQDYTTKKQGSANFPPLVRQPTYNKPPSYGSYPTWGYGDDSKKPDDYHWPAYGGGSRPPQHPFFSNGPNCENEGADGNEEVNKNLEGLLQQAVDSVGTTERTTTKRPDPPPITSAPNTDDLTLNQQQPQQTGGSATDVVQTIPNLSAGSAADSINIQETYFRPTFQNTTYLRKCGEYFRQVPVLKGKHTPVVGGRDARPKEFPHLALLGYGESNDIQWLCGGSLISDQYVLTAAHCVFAKGIGLVGYIRLGELDLNSTTEESDVKDFTVSDRIIHPLYTPLASYHDIAILRMNASVSFNSYIRPICLATTTALDGKIIVTAGWGLTEYGGVPANILQRATLKHVPNDRCRRAYGTPRNLKNGIIEAIHVCADGGSERRDACQGDSGGPLQYTNYEYEEERDLLGFVEIVGVTSFGKGCGLTAGVYTRVLPYVQWIERIVWPNETP